MSDIITSKKLSSKIPDNITLSNSYAFNPTALTDNKTILELLPNEVLAAGCGNGNSGTGSSGERQVNSLQSDIDNYPNITQSETSLAHFGEFILFGFNDSNDAPERYSGYGFSSDSGATWSDCGSVPIGGDIVSNLGDPVIAVDSQGIFYYAHLGNTTTGEQVIILNTGQVNTTDRTFQFNNPIVVGTGVGDQDKE